MAEIRFSDRMRERLTLSFEVFPPKTEKGMHVLEGGIVGGILMRTREDFAWCVENMSR